MDTPALPRKKIGAPKGAEIEKVVDRDFPAWLATLGTTSFLKRTALHGQRPAPCQPAGRKSIG
jgi:hypothetical protein